MPGGQGIKGFLGKLFGPRREPTPAERWLAKRGNAGPEEVVRAYFDAIAAHDLDWLLATMTPERARLYNNARTIDRRRQTVIEAVVHGVNPAEGPVPAGVADQRYKEMVLYRVEYALRLVPPENRRDPTLQEGAQWSYFALARTDQGGPWLIADWGLE